MAIEMILTRRSIRRFTPEAVADQDVREVLHAAMQAPSAGDQRPWHFCVIKKRENLGAIAQVHPNAHILNGAPLALLICGVPALERHPGYWVQDCSAATQNALLAIHAKKLGGVWIAVYPKEDRMSGVRSVLQIPDSVMPFALIAVGHPAEHLPTDDRFDPERVHFEGW